MTSTSIFQGSFAEKPSSRVIRPPGGGSSNIFGGPEEVKKPAVKPASVSEEPAAASTEPSTAQTPTAEPTSVPAAGEPAAIVAAEPCAEEKCNSLQDGSGEATPAVVAAAEPSAPVAAATTAADQPKKKKMGYNPITGESYEIAENNVKTSISVRQPPGGASSGLW